MGAAERFVDDGIDDLQFEKFSELSLSAAAASIFLSGSFQRIDAQPSGVITE